MKHTPTPWEVVSHNHIDDAVWHSILRGAIDVTHNTQPHEITCDKYSALPQEENEANAAFIVKAVNNHESLEHAAWLAHEHMKAYLTHYKAGFSVFDELEKAIKGAE